MQQTRFQWMLIHPAHMIAQGIGSGLLHPASVPGVLWSVGCFCILNQTFIQWSWMWWLILAVSFPIGVWACGVTGKQMGVQDDSSVVFDEIWAFWLVLAMLSPMHFSFWSSRLRLVCFACLIFGNRIRFAKWMRWLKRLRRDD